MMPELKLPGGYFITLEGDYAYLRRNDYMHIATLEKYGTQDGHKVARDFSTAMTRPDGGDSLREAKLPDFHEVMSAVEQGWQCWAMKPHNKKWLRMVESTPIPNDVRVNISSAIVGWLKTWQENQASLVAKDGG